LFEINSESNDVSNDLKNQIEREFKENMKLNPIKLKFSKHSKRKQYGQPWNYNASWILSSTNDITEHQNNSKTFLDKKLALNLLKIKFKKKEEINWSFESVSKNVLN